MKDEEIIQLFLERSDTAIQALSKKYGRMCKGIARNILHCKEDEEECMNDSFMAFWEQVPPQSPNPVKAYLGKLVRNICIKRYHQNRAMKRNSTYDVALDELEDVLCSGDSLEEIVFAEELTESINEFLDSIDKESRGLFVHRYWYGESMKEIGEVFHLKSTVVPVKLARIRGKLKKHLQEKEMIS